jgi:hypothetical protein
VALLLLVLALFLLCVLMTEVFQHLMKLNAGK